MKWVVLLLILGLGTVSQAVERRCPDSMECRVVHQCTDFLRQETQLKTLVTGTEEHAELLARLLPRVCDSKNRKVCCDRVSPEISGSIGPTLPHEFPFMVQISIRVTRLIVSLPFPYSVHMLCI